MYLLPWEEITANIFVRREALSSMRPVMARIDYAAGRWIGKITYQAGITAPSYYKPSGMDFTKVCSANTKEEAMEQVDAELAEKKCKDVDPKLLVMI